MNNKKLYIWKLADFLSHNKMTMSNKELAIHLNRNNFLTSYGSEYAGGRGTFKLIRETWHWLNDECNLPSEAEKVATSYVKKDGTFAYKN